MVNPSGFMCRPLCEGVIVSRALHRRLPAIYEKAGGGHERRLIRGQEQYTVRHLTWGARTFEHRVAAEFVEELLRGLARGGRSTGMEARENRSWADGVDADALHRMVQGHAARQPGNGGLGRIVLHHVAPRHEGPL